VIDMLVVKNIEKRFGGLLALSEISLDVPQDRLVAIIGPNGAGKTTLFNVMSGFQRPDTGEITFFGEGLVGLRPHEVSRRGIVRTFQICKPFPDLSVLDNVVAGAFIRASRLREATELAEDALNDIGLYGKRAFLARYLTLPELKRLEVARALAVGPRYLLLDEVMAGLNIKEQHEVADDIERIHARGIGIVLVEHSLPIVMRVARHVVCLDNGRKIAEGSAADVMAEESVRAAYMGVGDGANA
jgi:branched-chain amino acid transport system ATP-binding protein